MITEIKITAVRRRYKVHFKLETTDEDGPDFDEWCDYLSDVFDCIARNIAKENRYDVDARELFDAVLM